jgi:hypothetical protein
MLADIEIEARAAARIFHVSYEIAMRFHFVHIT